MRKSLRNLKTIFLLLTIMTAMFIVVGCGDGKQDDSAMLPEQPQPTDTQDQPEGDPSDTLVSDASDTTSAEFADLCVDVESVGDHSVVGSKITIQPGLESDSSVMVIAGGGDNKELVSIYFAEDASYVYETIRNGGADVETREGSFSDIEIGLILDLTGYYKGDDFYANEVRISKVILN